MKTIASALIIAAAAQSQVFPAWCNPLGAPHPYHTMQTEAFTVTTLPYIGQDYVVTINTESACQVGYTSDIGGVLVTGFTYEVSPTMFTPNLPLCLIHQPFHFTMHVKHGGNNVIRFPIPWNVTLVENSFFQQYFSLDCPGVWCHHGYVCGIGMW